MSRISLRTNIASLRAQTQVSRASSALSQNFERLSSGLRINRASDDAAGLAVADGLRADAKVYSQAILNVNESISLLNVADAAATELGNILSNLRELATEASNSTLTSAQRKAIDTEGKALTDEFNRIVDATGYNDLSVFDEDRGNLSTQAGYGADGAISFDVGSDLERGIGDGTFQDVVSYASGGQARDVELADINNDNFLDMIYGGGSDDRVNVRLGNGDGTFGSETVLLTSNNSDHIVVADFDGDNNLDIASVGGGDVKVLIGNGDGTFEAEVSYSDGANSSDIVSGDIDGDGDIDIITSSLSGGVRVNVSLNNGNGTFAAAVSYLVTGSGPATSSIDIGDVDNDGDLDIVASDLLSSDSFFIMEGAGDGTLSTGTSYSFGANGADTKLVDVNLDGNLDAATILSGSEIQLRLGNGDGTFGSVTTISTATGGQSLIAGDYNGDGLPDLIAGIGGTVDAVQIFQGDGAGSFSSIGTFASSATNGPVYLAVGDVNGDDAMDVVSTDLTGASEVYVANADQTTTIQRLNLSLQSTAQEAISVIDAALTRITLERGEIGAALSQHSTASSLLFTQRDNYLEAESNIRDVDVAAESADLVRNQIVQEAAVAVLTQANLQSNLALDLLGDI